MTPFYSEGGIEIYHGDCADVLPRLNMGGELFDLLLTDPPYGIGEARATKRLSRGGAVRDKRVGNRVVGTVSVADYGDHAWDDEPVSEALIALVRGYAAQQIIFGGNYFAGLPPSPCWLVWDKENGDTDFADCELAWTNMQGAVRMKRHLWNGMIQKYGSGNSRKKEHRYHPTQKPLEVMTWALSLAGDAVHTVVDPFMGSGTTLVAAKLLGKKCVGIDKVERYCEDAAKRLAQGVLPLTM